MSTPRKHPIEIELQNIPVYENKPKPREASLLEVPGAVHTNIIGSFLKDDHKAIASASRSCHLLH